MKDGHAENFESTVKTLFVFLKGTVAGNLSVRSSRRRYQQVDSKLAICMTVAFASCVTSCSASTSTSAASPARWLRLVAAKVTWSCWGPARCPLPAWRLTARGRRVEVVAKGLPIWRGVQVAVDTTLVSPVQRRAGCDAVPGLALQQAAARKRRTYPELRPDRRGRCRLVVFGLELGGRFGAEALGFLRRLARARGAARAPWCSGAAGRALVRRWTGLVSLAALRAHAATLLELPACPVDPSDGAEVPIGDLLVEPL